MLSISAKIRQKDEKAKTLRKQGLLPAILYGLDITPLTLKVPAKEFDKIYEQAGESTLLQIEIVGQKGPATAIIQDVQRDPLSGKPIHVDFYQPRLTEKIEVKVPIVFEGESAAVKELGGTLIRQIQELTIKALPQNLPKEIVVDTSVLNTFEDAILIKDLKLPPETQVLHHGENDLVAKVAEPAKVEEELEKPIEEKVEEVERVEKEKKEKEEAEME